MSQVRTKTGGADSKAASDARQTTAVEGVCRSGPDGRDDDELFEILANQRRRFALHYLRQRPDETTSLSALSECVAGWEHGVDPETLEYAERKSVRNSLHQFHLPKLDDAGIVAYDEDAGTVVLLDAGSADAYLAVAGDAEGSWAAYGAAASAGALGVAVLSLLGVLAAVPAVAWTALFAGALLLATFGVVLERCREQPAGPPPECDADG